MYKESKTGIFKDFRMNNHFIVVIPMYSGINFIRNVIFFIFKLKLYLLYIINNIDFKGFKISKLVNTLTYNK